MSIAEFTKSLRDKSNSEFNAKAEKLLSDFVTNATEAFQSKSPIRRAGSVITEGKAVVGGREIALSREFRRQGERQGRTRLILTEDDLVQMFKLYNITSSTNPMVLYAVFLAKRYGKKLARHFEVYMRDGSIIERGRKPIADVINDLGESGRQTEIVAIRGLNFSHDNTAKHVAEFLQDCKAFPGKTVKEIQEIILGDYERGHVYAQTTGRALVSLGELVDQENILNSIVKLYEIIDERSSSLSEFDGKYQELLARCRKDFTGSRLAMNIQFQLKRVDTGKGNQDTADISKGVQIVKFLQNLIKNVKLTSTGKKLISDPAAVNLREFDKALTDLNTKLTKYQLQINRVLAGTTDSEYLSKLQTSDSLTKYITNTFDNIFRDKPVVNLKVDTGNKQILKTEPFKVKLQTTLEKIKPKINSFKNDLKKNIAEIKKTKTAKLESRARFDKQSTDLISLQNLLNQKLIETVKQNMGTGNDRNVLNLRTGRFAESVRVDRLSESKLGAITAFYSYMRNPYATFSSGGQQSRPSSRDPKLLISKSIRQVAAELMITNLRSVNV